MKVINRVRSHTRREREKPGEEEKAGRESGSISGFAARELLWISSPDEPHNIFIIDLYSS